MSERDKLPPGRHYDDVVPTAAPMTISLEEHVARAIANAKYKDGVPRNDDGHYQSQQFQFLDQARAAIAAVREPAPDAAEAMREKWEKLERATQPFRSVFETYPVDRFPDSEIVSIKVTFGDLRELGAALKGKGEG